MVKKKEPLGTDIPNGSVSNLGSYTSRLGDKPEAVWK